MPSVDVKNLQGGAVGTVELPSEWFEGEVNVHVMHEVVTAQLAAARQGTHKSKTRAEVRGGGRKPWRQKGTGRARQGSIRSPQWVGGGHANARTPRDYRKRVNKKVRRAALRSALIDRVNNGAFVVIREFAFAAPKTKDAVAALIALDVADRRVLVVLGDLHQPTLRSFRNLQHVHLITVDQLNTYDVLRSDVVLFDETALELIGTGKRTGNVGEIVPTAAPEAEEPATEAPAVEEPATEAPEVEESATGAPEVEEPATETSDDETGEEE